MTSNDFQYQPGPSTQDGSETEDDGRISSVSPPSTASNHSQRRESSGEIGHIYVERPSDLPPDERAPKTERLPNIYISQSSTDGTQSPSFIHWWYLEVFCIILSFASLGAQIGVLLHYDGKPRDSWPSDVLTLNSLIAILATICRTSFMVVVGALIAQAKWNRFSSRDGKDYFPLKDYALLDKASREIWGSMHVIWRFKGGHIACLGAALTVLSQAFGLFSQQLVSQRDKMVGDRSPGNAGRVAQGVLVDSVTGIGQVWTANSATKLAMHNGYMAPSIDIPSVICPTGNCTWPIVPTVGVCGACVNITDDIEFDYRNGANCQVTTSGGIELEGMCENADFGLAFTVGPSSGRIFGSSPEIPERNASNVIAEFGAVGVPRSKGAFSVTLNDSIAAECAIWYCLQARNVSVSLGVPRDDLVETWIEVSTPFGEFSNVTFTNVPSSFNVEAGETFGTAAKQMEGMRQYANKTILGNVSIDGTLGLTDSSSDFAEGLHNAFDDIDAWIERLARSMTNNVRLNSSGSTAADNGRYTGTTFSIQATIVVRWEWIAFPAALVGISLVYLVVEVMRTARTGARPWKSDPLLPACMGFDEGMRERASQGLDEPDGVLKQVGDYTVRVRRKAEFPGGLVMETAGREER